MDIVKMFLKELDHESGTTRKMLSRVPDDKYDWKPHEKNMTIRQLATHIAELPTWINLAINTTGLDFAANPYKQVKVDDTKSLMEFFEKCLADAKADLEKTNEEALTETWTLRNGEHVLSATPKHEVIRMVLNQITHHRAQLGVYLRLLGVALPSSYGPSADESF